MLNLKRNHPHAFAWVTRRGLSRKRFCVNCEYCKAVRKSKTVLFERAKDGKYENIVQPPRQHGCLISREQTMDYVTGLLTRILRNCKDKNPRGECKNYRRKWWKIWTT